ncbi:helix-turn-helix domain-containing protein [Pseudomonadota bacterium]
MKDRVSYSPAECAQLLGICKNHIYKSFENGELRSFKLGQRRLINREALDDFRLELEKRHTAEMRGEGNE